MSSDRWFCLAAAVLPVSGCQTTSGSGSGSAVQIDAGPRLTLTGTIAAPERFGPDPAIALMHGCNVPDCEMRRALQDHSRYLLQAGFVTLILDSLTPGESGHMFAAATLRFPHPTTGTRCIPGAAVPAVAARRRRRAHLPNRAKS